MSDCIICKIAGGEIPSYKVYEDDYVLAFLDIHPHAKGHTVVTPKVHRETPLEMSGEEWNYFSVGLRKALEKVEATLHPDGYDVGWNQKPAGGQVVPHLHVHIFPRFKGDGGGSMHSIVNNPGDMTVEEVAKLFK